MREPGVLLAHAMMLVACAFHKRSPERVTPRCLKEGTRSMGTSDAERSRDCGCR